MSRCKWNSANRWIQGCPESRFSPFSLGHFRTKFFLFNLIQIIFYIFFLSSARFHWKADDPEIVSDVLFAIANVISFARTTFLMPAFEVLGPLQISLGRMIGDITRFMVLFTLVCALTISIIFFNTRKLYIYD